MQMEIILIKYLENEYLPQTDKVRELFEGIHIPTQDDWARLKEDVMKYGVYNPIEWLLHQISLHLT